jgi:hypothetical protein
LITDYSIFLSPASLETQGSQRKERIKEQGIKDQDSGTRIKEQGKKKEELGIRRKDCSP